MLTRVLVAVVLLCASVAEAATYYVRTDGNNANAGTTNSAGGAWRTIDKCMDTVVAGDICRVQAGNFVEVPTPLHNGSSGNTITVVADGVATLCGVTFSNNSYIRLVGLVIDYSMSGCSALIVRDSPVLMSGTNTGIEQWHLTHTHGTYGYGGASLSDRCNNCLTIGNRFIDINVPDLGRGGGSAIAMFSDRQFVAYNEFGPVDADAINLAGCDSRFINNFLHDAKELSGHADFFQTDANALGQCRNLYEANFQRGQGNMLDEHTGVWQNLNLSQCGGNPCGSATEQVWRRNVWHNLSGGSLGIAYAPVAPITFSRIYNNTTPIAALNQSGTTAPINLDPDTNNNYVFNEIFYQAWTTGFFTGIQVAGVPGGSTLTADYNLAFHPGGTLSSFGGTWTAQAHPRSNVNPNFVDVAGDDFHLAAGSGDGANARGTGGPLTTTSGSGTGTTFNVAANGGGFFRGDDTAINQYGGALVKGDTICVGTDVVEIASITGDAITTTTSFTWANGEGVYFGDDCSPDIGAYPYKADGYTLSATYGGSGTITITPNDASLVRFVVCYSDAVPYTVDNTSPYTCSSPSGTFTAWAYPLYASTTLRVQALAGATRHVANKCANNGDGTGSGCAGSAGAAGAYNNLQTALTAAVAGDTVIVYGPESGNSDYVTANGAGYTNAAGFTFANSGTLGNPITLRNATGERPVLRPCAAAVTDLTLCNRPTLNANDKEYIVVTSASCPTSGTVTLGLHIYGAIIFYDFPAATEAAMSHGSEISCVEVERGYSSFDDGNWSGIWTAGQYGITVRHNSVHDITYAGMTNTGAQSSTSGLKTFLTSFSTFNNNTINHVIPTQAGGIDCKADCVSNQIYENQFLDVSICFRLENQETGGGPYTAAGSTGTSFRNNLCVSAAGSVRGAVRFEDGKTTDVAIFNNTLVGFLYGLEEVHGGVAICQGVSFYNNALSGTTDNHVTLSDGGGTECTLTRSNYNFFGTAATVPRFRYAGTNYNALSNFIATGFDVNSTELADASFLFTNAAGGVYTLQAGSPLQSAGKVGGVIGGAAVDVGAYTDTIPCIGYACTAGAPDTTAPVVTITAPTSAATFSYSAAGAVTISGTATDAVGVSSCTCTVNRGSACSVSGTTSWLIPSYPILQGATTVTVTCADAAGNMGADVIDVTYTPPLFRNPRLR